MQAERAKLVDGSFDEMPHHFGLDTLHKHFPSLILIFVIFVYKINDASTRQGVVEIGRLNRYLTFSNEMSNQDRFD